MKYFKIENAIFQLEALVHPRDYFDKFEGLRDKPFKECDAPKPIELTAEQLAEREKAAQAPIVCSCKAELDALKKQLEAALTQIKTLESDVKNLKESPKPAGAETVVAPPQASDPLKLNINKATVEQLDKLPDWGLVTAQKIIDLVKIAPLKDDADLQTRSNGRIKRTDRLKLLTTFI